MSPRVLAACAVLVVACALPEAERRDGGTGGAGTGGTSSAGADPGGGGSGGGPAPCRQGEVYLGRFGICIDAFEASRGPADEAESLQGELPWVIVTLIEAQAACVNAGKRLCTLEEWREACGGPNGLEFPYGDTYDPNACNGATGAILETGQLTDCMGGLAGLFDMSGNAHEWVGDCTSGSCYEAGGSYENGEPNLRCTSTFQQGTDWADPSTGFRCCRTPE
jgi:hypothetical protein